MDKKHQSNGTHLECMLKNFRKGFNGDYRVKLTPNKLKGICELDWLILVLGGSW
jgi:hypothetical protein